MFLLAHTLREKNEMGEKNEGEFGGLKRYMERYKERREERSERD